MYTSRQRSYRESNTRDFSGWRTSLGRNRGMDVENSLVDTEGGRGWDESK